MNYEVVVEYMHFTFDTPAKALNFAEEAKRHYHPRRDSDDNEIEIEVKIFLKNEKEEEQ